MKLYNFNKLWLFALCISLTVMSSCEKALDINKDPNNSPTSTVKLQLPTSQVGLAMALGEWNYRGAIWAQYWTGGQGVGTDNLERYNMVGTDADLGWRRAYSNALADMDFLVKSNQPVYAGIGKVMKAYTYQMLVDIFGPVPFSEALKGEPNDGGIIAPKYDTQEEIYSSLIAMLNEAITTNLPATGALVLSPGSEDLIYGGNISKWIAFANTLKLKILVRQGNKNTEALALINSGVSFINQSNSATIRFTETTRNLNPIYNRFDGGGLGMYFVAAAASIDTLKNFLPGGVPDPRIDALYKKPLNSSFPSHIGILSGEVNNFNEYKLVGGETAPQARAKFSSVGVAVYGRSIPEYFISSWESKFLQAEVIIKSGGDATSLVNDGIQLNFDVLGISSSGPAYTSALAFNATATIDNQLNVLGIQKWISFNGLQMIEGWIESVRFDRPGNQIFTAQDNTTFNSIFTDPSQNVLGTRRYPSSFVYPTQEVANNPNTPAGRVVTDKRFWDL